MAWAWATRTNEKLKEEAREEAQIANARYRTGCVVNRAEDYGACEMNQALACFEDGAWKANNEQRWRQRNVRNRLVEPAAGRGTGAAEKYPARAVTLFNLYSLPHYNHFTTTFSILRFLFSRARALSAKAILFQRSSASVTDCSSSHP